MSQELNIAHLIDTLKFFRETISYLALNEDSENLPKINKLNEEYALFLVENIDAIADNFQKELAYYLNFYDVKPENDVFDEFKNYYFLGMAIVKELEACGKVDPTKYQLRAILHLLDKRLLSIGAKRNQLTKRLKDAITNSAISTDFGRFGWYILYKCLYNATNEASPKTSSALSPLPD